MARILLADDNPTLLSTLKVVMQMAGHTPVVAGNGADALDLALRGGIDLALFDVEMPEMNGIALCRAVKASPLSARIPVLMMTGSSLKAFVSEALSAGALEVLKKPFGAGELMAMIARHLPGQGAEDAERTDGAASDGPIEPVNQSAD